MDGHKTETQVTENTRSRVSRPQCPSACHQFTLSLGWNDHLNSSVVHKTCVNSFRKFSTLSGCEPVSPSRIRLPVKAFPARHCQKSPISPRHLGRRNTLVNIRLVANVPLTLHTDAQLPWFGNSLQTSVPLRHCPLAFRRDCFWCSRTRIP